MLHGTTPNVQRKHEGGGDTHTHTHTHTQAQRHSQLLYVVQCPNAQDSLLDMGSFVSPTTTTTATTASKQAAPAKDFGRLKIDLDNLSLDNSGGSGGNKVCAAAHRAVEWT